MLRPDGTGTLTVNELEYACAAPSPVRLHAGVLARATAVARTVSRPVPMLLTDSLGTRHLAVHPDGRLQVVHADGTAEAAPPVADSPCRRCGTPQDVTAETCPSCGTLEPHRVELTAVAVLDAAALAQPDELLVASSVRAPSAPVRPRAAVAPQARATPPVQRRALRLTFDTREPVTVQGGAALGRDPAPIGGRQPVRLSSPSMLVSKTHAFIDVDDAGTIRVTDGNSTNGTVLLGPPQVRLRPGEPVVVPPGTALELGDVTCRVDLVGAGLG